MSRRADRYARNFERGIERAIDRCLDEAVVKAQTGYDKAPYAGIKDITVRKLPYDGNDARILAEGETVAFVEFGTGITFPDDHPDAAKVGAIRGGYGHGLGKLESWRYQGSVGPNPPKGTFKDVYGGHKGWIVTRGNPASKTLYTVSKELQKKVKEAIKQEVRKL